jgi:hypothetical protein
MVTLVVHLCFLLFTSRVVRKHIHVMSERTLFPCYQGSHRYLFFLLKHESPVSSTFDPLKDPNLDFLDTFVTGEVPFSLFENIK